MSKKSIDRAKKYAKKNKQSLSAMVENYFNMVADSESSDEIEISPNVLDLSGIIELPELIDLKDMYGNYLEEKYSS